MKKTLLILPCNKGAKEGNYFTQLLWKKIDSVLKNNNLRTMVDLCAIDCIITFKKQDKKGALVGEWEMDRVKGYDIHPHNMFNKKDSKIKLKQLINDVVIGLKRMEKKYKNIIIFVNVAPYRVALKNAVKLLKFEKRVTFIEWVVCGFGISGKLIKYLLKYIIMEPKGFVKINDRQIYNWKDERRRQRGINIYKKSMEAFK